MLCCSEVGAPVQLSFSPAQSPPAAPGVRRGEWAEWAKEWTVQWGVFGALCGVFGVLCFVFCVWCLVFGV